MTGRRAGPFAVTLAQTAALGTALGRLAPPNLVVALSGPLGAGKTTFTRAVAAGAGCDPAEVSSPTFVLVHEYQGRVPVTHCDAYRLRRPEDFGKLGLEEHFAADGICLVEWADRVLEWLPGDRLEIAFAPHGPETRTVAFHDPAGAHAELLEQLNRVLRG
jgi:tRNA threonylcarbamoyladenosine biosynthesis protein TsaE